MKKLLLIASSLIVLICIAGCSSNSMASPDSKEITILINKAEASRQIASKEGVEFRFNKKFIENARTALEDGNLKKARMLAKKALVQAKRAVEQKKIQAKNWKLAIPK